MPQSNVQSKEVVAEINAQDLYDEFSSDEQSAQTKYLGKVVVVSGVIDDKYEDENGSPVLILKSPDGEPAVLITMESNQKGKLANYNPGDQIRVKAQCSGLLMEVTLNKGIVEG